MAGQIRISPEQMRGRAKDYENEASKVGDVISRMDSLLGLLQAEWEGAASESYARRYEEELKPNFFKAQELINEIATALNQTANTLEETDASIASGFNG